MTLTLAKNFSMFLALAMLASCGMITNTAKTAAREWWQENGKTVAADTAESAKKFWNENKGEIIATAKENTIAYVDKKLGEQREKAIEKMIAAGAKREDIDADHNGTISDEEVEAYVKANPKMLWYGGGALAAWWALWQLKKRSAAASAQQPAPKETATQG